MDYIKIPHRRLQLRSIWMREMVNSLFITLMWKPLARTQVFINLPDDTSKLVDKLWAEVKMGGPGESAVLVAIILGFLAVYVAIVIYKRRKFKTRNVVT